jgi:hypothetical protein
VKSVSILFGALVLVSSGAQESVMADTDAGTAATDRVQALRREVQQNDQYIRDLEANVRTLRQQRQSRAADPRSAAVAAPAGEISAWSSSGLVTAPTLVRPAVPAPGVGWSPDVTAEVAPHATVRTREGRLTKGTAPALKSRKSALRTASLKRGLTQERVWDALGPPEFVRGKRAGVQYWHYGAGWVRFQDGRVTRWVPGQATRQAQAVIP